LNPDLLVKTVAWGFISESNKQFAALAIACDIIEPPVAAGVVDCI